MKTQQEVERARRHLRDSLPGAVRANDRDTAAMTLAAIDMLDWVLGNPSQFAEMVATCDAVDSLTVRNASGNTKA